MVLEYCTRMMELERLTKDIGMMICPMAEAKYSIIKMKNRSILIEVLANKTSRYNLIDLSN